MRKSILLLFAVIIFVFSVLIIQSKLNEEKNSFAEISEDMGRYEYDKRMLGIAISRVMTSDAVYHNFGKPIYPEDKNLQYVWVYIKLVNSGTAAVQVSPDEFFMSVPGEDAVKYDLKATESMQKALNPIELAPDKQGIGVLIFPLPESSIYILHYDGPEGKVEKRLVIGPIED